MQFGRGGGCIFRKRNQNLFSHTLRYCCAVRHNFFSPWAGLAFALGMIMSTLAGGLVGMKAAVIYNERVANEARLGIEKKIPTPLAKH